MVKVLAVQTAVIVIYMTGWFGIAQAGRRNDVADIAWGTGFIVIALTALMLSESVTPRGMIAMILVLLWGVRLALHIYMRNRGKPEDARYTHAVIRAYVQLFLFQGLLMVIISLPVTYIIVFNRNPIGVLDILGLLMWCAGFTFEAVGDYQLVQYKRDPAHKGKVMTQGLWTYTRHPNYFGEVILWWGVYIIALSVPQGWATILGPLTITFLILKVSGIPLLEEKYSDNPEFQAYKKRTSAFFPLPPRKEA
jgi:steroid 5-alpha reductase family enzyme